MCQAEEHSHILDEVSRADRSLGKVVPVAMLDIVEQSLGIITASLPALTAYIAKYVKKKHSDPFFYIPRLFRADWEAKGSGVISMLKRQSLNHGRPLSSSQPCLKT